MRYVPNLIPENSKVLPDYFNGNPYEPEKQNLWIDIPMWILGITFFIASLISLKHPLVFLLFGATGFILIPPGHRFLERKFRFRLTTKIKVISCAALFIPALPLTGHYSRIDREMASRQAFLEERAASEKSVAEHVALLRKDSLYYYIQQSSQLSSQHKIEEAGRQLNYALAFASTPSDKNLIEKEKVSIASVKVHDLVKAGKYKAALPEINSLLEADPSNADLMYDRAVCYSKTGAWQEAVDILKPLMQAGNTDAEKLHNKINPVRKKIIGYETLCCDGTTSYARGRGACSHHGGVCDWNHPIYEEYRKYE